MRYVWDTQDVKPGRRLHAHNRSEEWIMAYLPDEPVHRWCIVSTKDGMVSIRHMTIASFVEHLNKAQYRPLSIELDDYWTPDADAR